MFNDLHITIKIRKKLELVKPNYQYFVQQTNDNDLKDIAEDNLISAGGT